MKVTNSDLMNHVYAASAVRGRWFRRAEDTWSPALFHRDAAGEVFVTGVQIPIGDTKDVAARAIQAALQDTRSVEALLVAPAWEALVSPEVAESADITGGTGPGLGRQDFDPERHGLEVLLFVHVGTSFALTRSASVLRRPGSPPSLGPLSEIRGEGIEVNGLLTDAMRRGIG